MQNFTRRIVVEGFSLRFFFHKMYTVKGISFHISVADRNNRSHFFNMEQTASGWRIVNAPKVPDWLIRTEQQLVNAIEEELANRP
jgi:hypothetical protein